MYILYSSKIDHYYVGISGSPEKRLQSHNEYPKGWTVRGVPWELVFQKVFPDRATAHYWERFIKKQKSRSLIEKVIAGEFKWEK
ncbi:MAG: GIY-YIG nuclease family protein [Calditrichaeota bacterium]|nr:GIY-YIG nuclease family protein [Calditrichota bacterium]